MKLKKNYYEDIQLLQTRESRIWLTVLIIFLAILPFWVKSYNLFVINLMAVNAVVALGLNLLVGNTGLISLGHAGFVAIGGYSTVLLMVHAGIPFLLAILVGTMISALFGAILGVPALRLEGPYLAIATLGFGLAVGVIIGRWQILGGRMGLTVPKIDLSWTGLKYDTSLYYVIITLTCMMTLLARNILKSRIGRAFQAIRDSDIAASTIGVNLSRYKTLSFVISAGFAGFAGGLWVFLIGFINPDTFSFIQSIQFLAIIILGGLGSITGSVLGAIVFTLLSLQLENVTEIPLLGDFLNWISIHLMSLNGLPYVTWMFTGLILILIVVFEPMGLYGIWLRIKLYWKSWPF